LRNTAHERLNAELNLVPDRFINFKQTQNALIRRTTLHHSKRARLASCNNNYGRRIYTQLHNKRVIITMLSLFVTRLAYKHCDDLYKII